MSEDALDGLTEVEDLLHIVGEGNSLPLLDYHLKTVNSTFRESGEGEGGGEGRRERKRERENPSCDSLTLITHKERENT